MTGPTRSTASDSARSGARRGALAALLLGATLAAGAGARLAWTPGPTPLAAHGGDDVVALDVRLDRESVLRGSDGELRVELVLRGTQDVASALRQVPTDLVVVLDRSGSMNGRPLETALAGVRELIGSLSDGDRFALVSYASDARVDVALEAAGPATRARWSELLGRVRAGGGTDLSSGLDRAHALLAGARRAGRSPRVIVLSDGLANQGDYSLAGLRRRAARATGSEYVLSSVGVGDGFDETLMSALADAGTGNFYYLPSLQRLAGVFAAEFEAARQTVARSLAVVLEPADGVRVVAAGGYPLERDAEGVRFRPGDLFAGQERRIWLTLRAPTSALGPIALGGLRVEFATPRGESRRVALEALPQLACVGDDDAYYASFDAEVYRRGNRSESVGALKQSVARKLAEGRPEEAAAEVEAYRVKSRDEQLRALGSFDADEKQELDALADVLSAPSVAEPEVRNRLGKQLLESGRDAQRAGAKR